MKFTADREHLAAAAAWAGTASAAKGVLPILTMLRLTAADGLLTVTGTDYAETARASLEAATGVNGTVYVPGRFFTDVVKMFPARQPVIAELDGSLLRLTCGAARFAMSVADEGFSDMPGMPPAAATAVGAEFAEAAQIVARSAGRDATLPAITGVYTEFAADHVLLVATDRYRLVKVKVPVVREDGCAALEPVLIPATTMTGFAKAAGAAGKITIAYDGTGVAGFGDGNREAIVRPISADFPKWRKQFPAGYAFEAVVDAELVADAARRCALASDAKVAAVQLAFTGDEVTVSADGADGAYGAETIPGVVFGGPDGTVRLFNSDYLIDGLAGARSKLARIGMQEASAKPAVITAADPDPAAEADPDPVYQYVLVPIRKT